MIFLNQNELEALRILWERGPSKPAEIQSKFSWPIENGTLRSVLVNLVEKGQATRKLQGKVFFYAARVPKTTLFQTMMQAMARVFAGGSRRELVAQLVETGDIKPDDIQYLRDTAAAKGPQKTRKKPR